MPLVENSGIAFPGEPANVRHPHRLSMTGLRPFLPFTAATLGLLLASCANLKKPDAAGNTTGEGHFANPHPAGTYEHFKAEPKYPKTYDVWKNDDLLAKTNASNSAIKIDLKTQRGMLLNNGETAIDYPICSGIPSRPTPTGTFPIMEKVVDKKSNKYGRILDASGNVVNSDADSTKDPVPPGGRFVGASMSYWMRLTGDGVGHHIGPVKRRPASHACIRGPSKIMPIVYSKVKIGTKVIIE